MLKHIFTILWNERRNNLLIWVEMLIIALCSIYLVDYLVSELWLVSRPMGCDIHNVARIRIGIIPPESPDHIDAPSDSASTAKAVNTLLQRIEAHPSVESTCISLTSQPYQGSNSSYSFTLDTLTVSSVLVRTVTPSFLRVFRVESENSTCEEMEQALENKQLVAGELLAKMLDCNPPDTFNGKEVMRGDSSVYKIGAVCKNMRIDNFWGTIPSIFIYEDEFAKSIGLYVEWMEYALRLKDDANISFDALFAELKDQLRVDNFYVTHFEDLGVTKQVFQKEDYNALKIRLLYVVFLAICIFLGIVGTFWYRAQQRRSQIGLRLAMGDTPRHLLWLYNLEGLLMLYMTLVFTIPSYYLLKHYEILHRYWSVFSWRVPLVFGITYGVITLLIFVAICLPTYSAVHTAPSIAMRDE